MVWNKATSAFEALPVASITDQGSNVYRVVLTEPPSAVLTVGMRVSPDMGRRAVVAQAVSDYFDELGPGELFDLTMDPRGGRCERFPPAAEERPFRAGGVIATRVSEALGGSAADTTLDSISKTVPSYPTDLMDGPYMLVPGDTGVYPL